MDPRTAKTPLFVADGISWIGLLAGPFAWALDEEISYFLIGWSCHAGRHWPTHGVSAAALLLIIAGSLLSWRDWRQRAGAGDTDNRAAARARFLALSGFMLCLLFGLVVLADAFAKFMFDPCQR
jgi:hypothetical protein